MRNTVLGLIGAALAGLALWACSGGESSTPAPARQAEQRQERAQSVLQQQAAAVEPAETQSELADQTVEAEAEEAAQANQTQQAQTGAAALTASEQTDLQPDAGSQEQQAQQEAPEAEPVPPPRRESPRGDVWIEQISAGGFHNCVLWSDGWIDCWGANGKGQSNAPAGAFSQVDAGYEHTCAVSRDDERVVCWGSNEYGEIDAPGDVYVRVSAGREHTCALLRYAPDGSLGQIATCWGRNHTGQLNDPYAARDGDFQGGHYDDVSAGSGHTCALLASDSDVLCWGYDEYGQVSNPPTGMIRQLRNRGVSAVEVSAGAGHSCLRFDNGAVACWGRNEYGQAWSPAGSFETVSTGALHTCALTTNGLIECWGTNTSGQTAAPAGRYTAVSAGWYHSCALNGRGAPVCWGGNDHGQGAVPSRLLNAAPRPAAQSAQPEPVEREQVRSFGVGAGHTCATTLDDEIHCWGAGDWGQIDTLPGSWRWLDVGPYYTCAQTPAGERACWGSHTSQAAWEENGEVTIYWAYRVGSHHRCRRHSADAGKEEHRVVCFGDNTYYQAEDPPGFYDRVNVGGDHNCARTLAGELVCWGRNHYGQAEVPSGRYLDVAAGQTHTCAITSRNEIRCWGDNRYGQLEAPPGSDYVEIISQSSASHTCAATSTRQLVCWGSNDSGQLEIPPALRAR